MYYILPGAGAITENKRRQSGLLSLFNRKIITWNKAVNKTGQTPCPAGSYIPVGGETVA